MSEPTPPTVITRQDALEALLFFLEEILGRDRDAYHFQQAVRLGFALGTRDDFLDIVPTAALVELRKVRAHVQAEAERMPAAVPGMAMGRIW